uniref:Uncharacterized protein n=1 Tax=Arundo donax TaxID=35708 RepID=A0A0A8ZQH5_ARUDO
MMYESNPSLRIKACIPKVRLSGISSGNFMSPSRYCMTCRILGLASGTGWEHSSPSFSTRHAW